MNDVPSEDASKDEYCHYVFVVVITFIIVNIVNNGNNDSGVESDESCPSIFVSCGDIYWQQTLSKDANLQVKAFADGGILIS